MYKQLPMAKLINNCKHPPYSNHHREMTKILMINNRYATYATHARTWQRTQRSCRKSQQPFTVHRIFRIGHTITILLWSSIKQEAQLSLGKADRDAYVLTPKLSVRECTLPVSVQIPVTKRKRFVRGKTVPCTQC